MAVGGYRDIDAMAHLEKALSPFSNTLLQQS
jgi:hypothetical protein